MEWYLLAILYVVAGLYTIRPVMDCLRTAAPECERDPSADLCAVMVATQFGAVLAWPLVWVFYLLMLFLNYMNEK